MNILSKICSLLLLLSLSGAAMASGTRLVANPEQPYATFDNTGDAGILTLYYGAPECDYIELNTDGGVNLLYGTSCDAKAVKKVVIDESFKEYEQTTTSYWFENFTNLETIEGIGYINTAEVMDMSYMFYDCNSLKELDLSSFNTAEVTNMGSMFSGCSSLEELDLSSFNTAQVKDMTAMFCLCKSLEKLDLSSFNNAQVTDMRNMFYFCSKLATIYVSSKWSTGNVSVSEDMFFDCYSLKGGKGTEYDESYPKDNTYARIDGGESAPGYLTLYIIPYSTYETDGEENILTLYYGEPAEGSIRLNTEGIEGLLYGTPYFSYDVKKVIIDGSFHDFSPKSTNFWLGGLTKLVTIEGMDNLSTAEVEDMTAMFFHCESLTTLDLSSFNTSKVKNMTAMFAGCSSLKTIYVTSKWNTGNVTSTNGMFNGCSSLVGGEGTTYDETQTHTKYARIDGGKDNPGYLTRCIIPYATFQNTNGEGILTLCYGEPADGSIRLNTDGDGNLLLLTGYDVEDVKKVIITESFKAFEPTTTSSWFYKFINLTIIEGIENLNTAEVTDMYGMFDECGSLTVLDLSSFNTAKVTNMSSMFSRCSSLTDLDLSSFNTAKVTNMSYMFNRCSSLTDLDLSSFNTAKVKEVDQLFYECSSLTNLDISSFNTTEMKNMYSMFAKCSKLTNLDLSNFNTAKVYGMSYLFNGCNSLTVLDLSSFNTANVKYMIDMFGGCLNLQTIYVSSKWSTGKVSESEDMFAGCTALKGGKETKYDASHTDATYARIDGGKDNPGYLTLLINLDECDITMASTEVTYTGTENKPEVTVTYNGSALKETTDYTVAYTDNVNAGTATVTVTGKGNYQGTLTSTFTIAKAKPTYTVPTIAAMPYSATIDDIKKQLTKGFSIEGTPELKTGENTVLLTFTPDDTKNYETVNGIEITVTIEENPNTPVSSVVDSPSAKVWSYDGTIFIESVPDSQYRIIDLSGRVITTSKTTSTRHEIHVASKGVLIVIINGEAFKVAL